MVFQELRDGEASQQTNYYVVMLNFVVVLGTFLFVMNRKRFMFVLQCVRTLGDVCDLMSRSCAPTVRLLLLAASEQYMF